MSKTSQLGTCRTSYHHPTISLPTTALLISLGKIYTSLGIFYQLFFSINQKCIQDHTGEVEAERMGTVYRFIAR